MEAHTSLDSWSVAVVSPPTCAGQLGTERQGNETAPFSSGFYRDRIRKATKWEMDKPVTATGTRTAYGTKICEV